MLNKIFDFLKILVSRVLRYLGFSSVRILPENPTINPSKFLIGKTILSLK